jgi:transposase
MDPAIKYYIEFARLKYIPEYNRIRAEKRFLLIKEYEGRFLPEEAKKLGSNFKQKRATIKFCNEYGLSLRTFYRWLREYGAHGIDGLVPKFGNRREQHAITAKVPEGRKASIRQHSYRKPITAVVEIDTGNPLACLKQVNAIVQHNAGFGPEVSKAFARFLNENLKTLDKDSILSLPRPLTPEEHRQLEKYLASMHHNHRARAQALLMAEDNRSMHEITVAVHRARGTVYRWLRLFDEQGLGFIETTLTGGKQAEIRESRKVKVLELLHAPPSTYGINRTSWTYDGIIQAYENVHGEHLPKGALVSILRNEGYTWRHARKVLTSSDPNYRNKVRVLLDTLQNLKGDEAFFFIDEAGSWKVKKYGGKMLVPRGQTPTVPEIQRAKGSVSFIAALEACSNQVIWQFIERKSAAAVISLLKQLRRQYQPLSKLFLTWDAMSSHSADVLNSWLSESNDFSEHSGAYPRFEIVPLPSNAQFLNVIESVISGLRKAVIHNSDYPSREQMQEAISRYFKERNAYFKENPKKAGNKIWDKEILKIDELPGGLFRRM